MGVDTFNPQPLYPLNKGLMSHRASLRRRENSLIWNRNPGHSVGSLVSVPIKLFQLLFWNNRTCVLIKSYRNFGRSYCLPLQHHEDQRDALRSSEKPVNIYQFNKIYSRRFYFLQRRCEKLRSRKVFLSLMKSKFNYGIYKKTPLCHINPPPCHIPHFSNIPFKYYSPV
jgi:hypothetical protein